jgi:hypothetical protein
VPIDERLLSYGETIVKRLGCLVGVLGATLITSAYVILLKFYSKGLSVTILIFIFLFPLSFIETMLIYTGIRTIVRREGYAPNLTRFNYKVSPPIPASGRKAIWLGVFYILSGLFMIALFFAILSQWMTEY